MGFFITHFQPTLIIHPSTWAEAIMSDMINLDEAWRGSNILPLC